MIIKTLLSGNFIEEIKYFRLRKRTKHLAIMMTDIRGYTMRTTASSREQLSRLLDLHEILIKPEFKKFGGRVIKTIGDAFMVTFSNPTDAVLCGVAIQRKLKEHNKSVEKSEKLEVKIAINAGEVTVKKGDIFGEAVNIVARIESLAEANEIYITNSVYLTMNKEEVPVVEIGRAKLEGIKNKMRIFKVDIGNKKLQNVLFNQSSRTNYRAKNTTSGNFSAYVKKTKKTVSKINFPSLFKRKGIIAAGIIIVILGLFFIIKGDGNAKTEKEEGFFSGLFLGDKVILSGTLKLNGDKFEGAEVLILSENKDVIQKEKTNKKGEFSTKLKKEREYFVSIFEKVEISREKYKSKKERYREKYEKKIGDDWEEKFRDVYSRKNDKYYREYKAEEKVILTEDKKITIDIR